MKPFSEFYAEAGCRDGLRPECEKCSLGRRAEWYQKNREREIARVRAWQRENQERVNATARARRTASPGQGREGHLERVFGITRAQYEEMLQEQGGGCAICERPPSRGRSLHIDHDHVSGRVRGLLCFSCNSALGQLADDVDRLESAMAYLAGRDELTELAAVRARALRVA